MYFNNNELHNYFLRTLYYIQMILDWIGRFSRGSNRNVKTHNFVYTCVPHTPHDKRLSLPNFISRFEPWQFFFALDLVAYHLVALF